MQRSIMLDTPVGMVMKAQEKDRLSLLETISKYSKLQGAFQ